MYKDKKLNILVEIFGNYHISGNEHLFYCPKCESRDKKKLSINIDKDCFKCWRCDWSGASLARLIRRYGNYSQQRIWSEFDSKIEISEYEKIFNQTNSVTEQPEETIKLPEEFQSLCNKNATIQSLQARRYLKERGFTKQDIIKWKIGYCSEGEYEGRVVFPSFNKDGKVNYFVARSYTGSRRKYMNPSVNKDLVFNELYVDWTDDVVIVEGVFDAVKAVNAIPILGSTLREKSKLFQKIVEKDPAIYMALDPDAEKKAEKLINSLLSYDIEVYKVPIPSNKDVGDMTKQEFLDCKSRATLIKDSDYMLMRKIMSI